MSKSFDKNGVQFAWNASSITLAETCLRKYQLTQLECWQPSRKSVHLLFGGHYATALEHYFKHTALGMSPEDALIEIVREALLNTWERPECAACGGEGQIMTASGAGGVHHEVKEPCEECDGTGKGEAGPWVSDHNAKTRENLIRSIVWYFEHFKKDPTEIVHFSDGKPAVEVSFALDVDDGIVFAGHLDRLVEYSGDQFVMDQKTTGSTISPKFFDQFKPDTQMSMYTFAGKATLNQSVKGVIIDGAQIAVGFTRFERGYTFRTDSELNEWYDGAMYHIEAARKATRENFFPMNTASCGNYGGCPFRNICGKSPQVRTQFLKADFVQGTPLDPLEQR